jgi:hypothetical protein
MTLEEALKDEFILSHCYEKGIKIQDIKCFWCLDGEYAPWFGKAPHKNFTETGLSVLEDDYLPESCYPENFVLSDDCKNGEPFAEGTYYCTNLECQFSKDKFLLKHKGLSNENKNS